MTAVAADMERWLARRGDQLRSLGAGCLALERRLLAAEEDRNAQAAVFRSLEREAQRYRDQEARWKRGVGEHEAALAETSAELEEMRALQRDWVRTLPHIPQRTSGTLRKICSRRALALEVVHFF